MIYKLKAKGHQYPIRINTAAIPIMYINKIEKNWYELIIIGPSIEKYKLVINARENRSFVEFMGGEVEE